MALNLEKQLRFYGAYHDHPVNVAIHIVCVPLILMTFFLLLTNSPVLIPLPQAYEIPNLQLDAGTIVCAIYAAGYVMMEPVAGGLLAPLLLGGTAYSHHLVSTYGWTANKWAIALNIGSWLAQFVGHGIFEGRAPALLDNLFQAIFLAPFFVFLEVLFYFGYRPELHSRLQNGVKQDISKYKTRKGAPAH